ncbi:MAG TPA: hypothetical protein ENH45_02460 [Nitrospirae bacterium]|nr:hypothetical protein BMS3Bbin09_00902 [bacterium BMS3Bbin09]HDO67093.1 hypothetical protein [Nitrospirota bacterium]HDZ84055.1 hypothetical protein [Nitrospirota bacterium]HEW81267.1 hypothetical protein [Nitrospirota bacterium]
MNNRPENIKETSKPEGRGKIRDIISDKVEKLKQRDYTCPFCREVIKGISAFGRHLKDHCI